MEYKVIVSPEASNDIQNIYDYIAYEKQSVINAEAQISRLKKEIIQLDTMPNAFRLYPKEPWHSRGLRYFPVDNYLIFYIVDEENKSVYVLRVIGGQMDLSQIWK